MDGLVVALIILVVIVLIHYGYEYHRYSYQNTTPVVAPTSCSGGQCERYNVHREHFDDSKQAAELMREITRRNATFIEYMESKYLGEKLRSFDGDHKNRIDVVKGSGLYYSNPMEHDVASQIGDVHLRENIQERVVQLVRNYDPTDIHEISPLNKDGSTSYTENKKTLILCMRQKKPDTDGSHRLHDINTMMFVVLHELTHMMNNTWGHPYEFWVLFKFVLDNAVECGVYKPVNYREHPIVYCGMNINYNPLFDPRLTA